MKKKSKKIVIAAVAAMCIVSAGIVGIKPLSAIFTATAHTDPTVVTAGNMALSLTGETTTMTDAKDTPKDTLNSEGKFTKPFLPGDKIKYGYTLTHTGSAAADVREVVTLTVTGAPDGDSSMAMDPADKQYFKLKNGETVLDADTDDSTDVHYGTWVKDGKLIKKYVITSKLPDTGNGNAESITRNFTLDFDRGAGTNDTTADGKNRFMGCTAALDVNVYAVQLDNETAKSDIHVNTEKSNLTFINDFSALKKDDSDDTQAVDGASKDGDSGSGDGGATTGSGTGEEKTETVAYIKDWGPAPLLTHVNNGMSATSFSRSAEAPGDSANAVDISEAHDKSILLWMDGTAAKWYSEADKIGVENGNMFNFFTTCQNITSVDLSGIDTSNVTNMSSMFSGCSGLTTLDLSSFNTNNVTDMSLMFSGCSGLTSLDLSNFDTSKVTSMSNMFSGCSGLTSLDLSKFNTGNVTSMNGMFADCRSLKSLDVSKWNTNKVTSMNGMFAGCTSLTSLDVSSFDTQNVTDMGSMFRNCSGLTVDYGDNFETSKAGTYSGVTYQKKTA